MSEAHGVAIASAFTLLVACKHAPPPVDVGTEGGSSAVPLVASSAGPADGGLAAARCAVDETKGATLRDLGERRAVEVGDATPTPDGAVVGVIHSPATGTEALLAHVAAGEVREEWVVAEHAAIVPDAPPPKGLLSGATLYAAYVARSGAADGGNVAAHALVLRKRGVDAPVASYVERSVESLAFDAAVSADGARAAIVWDADSESAANGASSARGGGITIGVVPLGGGAPLAARVVSGQTADPDAPRIAPRGSGGWWVAWIAHRPEAASDSGAGAAIAPAIETPAEIAVYSWLELVSVGEDGAPLAAPRRITPSLGHVASFDLASRGRGALDVVVRDETQTREGEGGRVLRVVVPPDGEAEQPSVLVPNAVGRGSVDLVAGASDAWLTFSDLQDRALVLPMGAAQGTGLATPSVEGALEGARLLALSASEPGKAARFLATFPAVEGPLFREVTCLP